MVTPLSNNPATIEGHKAAVNALLGGMPRNPRDATLTEQDLLSQLEWTSKVQRKLHELWKLQSEAMRRAHGPH